MGCSEIRAGDEQLRGVEGPESQRWKTKRMVRELLVALPHPDHFGYRFEEPAEADEAELWEVYGERSKSDDEVAD